MAPRRRVPVDPDAVRATERVPHGGESDRTLLDFSANTNPETPPGVAGVYESALETARRYPDDDYADFRAAAGSFLGVDADRIVPTAGGLAGIRLAMAVCLEPGDRVLLPAPSFGEYAREAQLQGAHSRFVPHDELLTVDDDQLADCRLAVCCTPNNPTGELTTREEIAAFADRCAAVGTRLLVDEAFLGFTEEPSAATLDRPDVIVARSLTKLFGLPGLRAGYLVASGECLEGLESARPAWSLGTPAAAVGAHCLRQESFVAETRTRVRTERRRVRSALETRFDVRPSAAPFLCLRVDNRAVETVIATARQRGVAVRDARTFRGLDAHIRVAIKDRQRNDRLVAALGVDREPSD